MTVFLVGAGPGDPDLLTVRAARLLAEADCVVVDRLVPEGIRRLVRLDAEMIDVGKWPGGGATQDEIHEILLSAATRHRVVVRLKGGDPFVFARGGEEVDFLVAAGHTVEMVPGLSSALSAPALAGIAVTRRGIARWVTIATAATDSPDDPVITFPAPPDAGGTLVVLMGVQRRAQIAHELISAGWHPDTPVAAIEEASRPTQRRVQTTLGGLGESAVLSPAVLVIGAVAANSEHAETPIAKAD
ncbi:MAG: uroporphyrinogen-III C-methyltransferase [Acidimicrobiia bacterium]